MPNEAYIQKKSPIINPEDITMDDLNHLSADSFALWSLTSGAKVDGYHVDFDTHRYLLPIYMDQGQVMAWRKAAQLGATVWMLLRVLWWLEKNQGRKAGLYFPTKEGVENLSKDRLGPLMKSVPTIDKISVSTDKLGLKKIGDSSFYLFHLGGVASKDSTPLDYVAFDEVRLCSPRDIDQALERISHSRHKMRVFASTAGYPNLDIDARFQQGTQLTWHSKCGCPDGIDLSKAFPNCVVDDKKRGELYLRCPVCKYKIKDPQNGRYIAHNPGADFNSYHVSQLASKYISLKDIWTFYQNTTNTEEFYNAKLGLPFVDEANRGVTLDILNAAVRSDVVWAKPYEREKGLVMGVDQGGKYCVAVIGDWDGDRKRIRHIEIIEQENPHYRGTGGETVSPFKRLGEMMNEYDIRLCVVDGMPNYNEALQFAQDFPGRVYTSWYQDGAKDVVQWGDKVKGKAGIRKAGPHLKFKYHAVLSRYISFEFMFGEIRKQRLVFPDPTTLVQVCKDEKTGQFRPQMVCKDIMWNHLLAMIKKWKETNEEEKTGKWTWIYTGPDHLAHACNYMNVGLERSRRRTSFVFA